MMFRKFFSFICAVAVFASVASISAFAEEVDSTDNVESGFSSEAWDEVDVFRPVTFESLVSNPDYMVSGRGAKPPYSTNAVNLTKNVYKFNGSMWGCLEKNYSVYTNKAFTGKRSYHFKMYHVDDSSAPVDYQIINMSSNNEVKASGTIYLGDVVEITVSGFSPTSKMYVKFTGGSTQPRAYGLQFMKVEGYIS